MNQPLNLPDSAKAISIYRRKYACAKFDLTIKPLSYHYLSGKFASGKCTVTFWYPFLRISNIPSSTLAAHNNPSMTINDKTNIIFISVEPRFIYHSSIP